MAGLDAETRELILSTLRKYADKKLPLDCLLALDHNDEFPHEVLKELYDPNILGLHLLFIPEEYGGKAAPTISIASPVDGFDRSRRGRAYWPRSRR
jgi:alkylation response protein AidB-like acyl-CoA dehydrogenase